MKTKEDLEYWKKNAEKDYLQVPISVLRYIAELEESVNDFRDHLTQPFECNHQWQEVWKDSHFQSSWGTNRCMKCGELDEWQFDSPNIKQAP